MAMKLLLLYMRHKGFDEVAIAEILVPLLAIADDVKLFAKTAKGLLELFEALKEFSNWANLTIKVSKCGEVTTPKLGRHRSRAQHPPVELEVDGSQVPVVNEDGYRYLGCMEAKGLPAEPDRRNVEAKVVGTIAKMEVDGQNAGGLREYAAFLEQHAVAVPVYSQTLTQSLNGEWADSMDALVVLKVREKLVEVSNFSFSTIEYTVRDLHKLPKKWGGTGVARFNKARESSALAAAVDLLEDDSRLEYKAERENLKHYDRCYGRTKDIPHFQDLKGRGLLYGPNKGIQNHEFWSRVMSEATKVGLTLEFNGGSTIGGGAHNGPLTRRKAGKQLGGNYDERCWTKLLENRVQGAYFKALLVGARGSLRLIPRHDLPDDLVTFALLARCETLPVNGVLKRRHLRASGACECGCRVAGCKVVESVTHLLSGCAGRKGMYTARHDSVVDAFEYSLGPALKLGGWVLGEEYRNSARRATRAGWRVTAHALIVGALGAIDLLEWGNLIGPLRVDKAAAKLAIESMQREALTHSRYIWRARCAQLGRDGA
ncbi:hypothetical protein CYMTET_20499 [Cymbomonas tetramitiformis]|uniref:Reverse transcriptase domain-containing protein n=1 Tax=Cymbomonas tetramitiformis TaxID=36881 RepID=A0AAE0G3X8_9CHLO|nr:hypothetical protein CYMTET_20499 [Cymbomonas tetramitiformis]